MNDIRDYHVEADCWGCGFQFHGADSDALRCYAGLLEQVASSTLRLTEFAAHEMSDAKDPLPHITNTITGARLVVQIASAMREEAAALDKDDAKGEGRRRG